MRILVIEDEARIQAFLARGLEAEGYTVVAAGDGREGLDLATRHALGPRRARPAPAGPQRSAGPAGAAPHEAGAAGRDPLRAQRRADEAARLRARRHRLRREAVLARRAARADPRPAAAARPTFGDEHVLRGGNVVLDVARRQAGVGDRTADLSDREFRLLHHLLVHAGEVVSRERLLAEVWGYDFDPGSNVVEVCVRRLRQKLGPGSADRDGAECGLPAGCGVTAPRSRAASWRRSRSWRSSSDMEWARGARDPARARDLPRAGLARPPPAGGARRGAGRGRDARIAARAAGALPPRRLARAADAGHDRARASRAAAARAAGCAGARGGARRARPDGADRRAAAAAREVRAAGLRASRRSTSRRSSPISSSAGRRWRRAPGGSTSTSRGGCSPIPRRCGTPSTRCSRTRSSTPTRATPSSSRRTRTGTGGVVIEVSDSGAGVPPEALPRIFDRWARADGARTRERGGAGLGLAIVAAVARAHGGRCSVKPLPRGTAFRLHLPCADRCRRRRRSGPTPASEGEIEPALGLERRSRRYRGRAGT